jgi:ATP-dependent protease ClpP protease subunit
VSVVLGGGHSIGIPLAVSADKSFIAKSATMTAHPVRTTGLTLGVPQSFEYFRRMQDRITTFVSDNSHITKEEYNHLIMNTGELVTDIGTILDSESAVECGLIDSVGTLSQAIDALYEMIKQ